MQIGFGMAAGQVEKIEHVGIAENLKRRRVSVS
jgi:hypothetical protein